MSLMNRQKESQKTNIHLPEPRWKAGADGGPPSNRRSRKDSPVGKYFSMIYTIGQRWMKYHEIRRVHVMFGKRRKSHEGTKDQCTNESMQQCANALTCQCTKCTTQAYRCRR